MLKSEKVSIVLNKGNLPFYKKKSNKDLKIGDSIEIDVSELTKGSKVEVSAICDFCKNELTIPYFLYNKSFIKNGSFACSKKCAAVRTKQILIEKYGVKNISQVPEVKEKIKNKNIEKWGTEYYFSSNISKNKNKEIFIEKYGVDNPLKSDLVKSKVKETNLEKWGVEWTLQNKEIRDRGKKTNLEKWGSETPSKNKLVKDKIIKTNLERWGGNSPMCNDIIKEKSRNTTIENWGVDNPNKSNIIREKTKNTNIDKWGVEYPTQSDTVINKRRENNIGKWGTIHVHQSDIFRKNNTKIGTHENYLEYKGDGVSLFKCDNNCDHFFEINTDNFFSRYKQNIKLCTVCNPIGNHISHLEYEIFIYIKSIYDSIIVQSYRDGLEIDIYLPDLKLGFEFNGLYWHSEEWKEKNYHVEKTKYFKEKGIRIIHIWEDDWRDKREIIKSQISNLLGKIKNKLFARKCEIREVGLNECREFLDNNHIQGYANSKVKIGLYYSDILISLMTFDQFEGRAKMKEGSWNLNRFCSKLETNVIGGASKLLNHFIKKYLPNRIISYADYDWSDGGLYFMLDFSLLSYSNPDYKYIINNIRVHKSNFKKSKLKYECTENEWAISNGLSKIWDCGKIKFERRIEE